jgi:uncharacterized protein YhfF
MVWSTQTVSMGRDGAMGWRDLEAFYLNDDPALADGLAALVLDGRKHTACWALARAC